METTDAAAPVHVRERPSHHITVCICTFKREALLREVLEHVEHQKTDGQFTFSVVVCDNDSSESAKPVAAQFAQKSGVPVRYVVEPCQNIARARNRAVAASHGDYVAFLDDDEIPENEWLLSHFITCNDYGADGTLGATLPVFADKTPSWIVKGPWFRRRRHRTGTVIPWTLGRTGNTLLAKKLFSPDVTAFNPEFISGEDQDFFRRQIGNGRKFVWCDEALTNEIIPFSRWTARYLIRRSLMRGKMTAQHPTIGWYDIAKSATAIVAYSLIVPFFFLFGSRRGMEYFVKIFDHAGLMFGFMGADFSRETYTPR